MAVEAEAAAAVENVRIRVKRERRVADFTAAAIADN